MIYSQIWTGFRKKALSVLTDTLCELFLTGRLSEICRWTAHIVNISFKVRILCHRFRFFQNRFMTSCLKNSSLMKGQGTEITASKAPTVACKAEADFLQCRDTPLLFVHRMISSGIRQIINIVHFLLCQRKCRWILDDIASGTIILGKRFGCKRIGIPILYGKTCCIRSFAFGYFVIGRKFYGIISP